ncbi:hypothetical protein GGH12_002834 [Coemansia sp. RSA 1822]|nr:hypothetical protein GGH12_002834 [Coemansia sp. RSA 1822]
MAAYYIEVLDNLHVVDIYAEYGADTKVSSDHDIQLVKESEVKIGKQLTIRLPVATILHNAARSILPSTDGKAANWTRIRVPIAYSSHQQQLRTVTRNITEIDKPVPAATVECLEDICCQACGSSILISQLKTADCRPNVRDLPSAHWSELVDCWMCHPEEDKLNVNPELMHSFEPEKKLPTEADEQTTDTDTHVVLANNVHMWIGNTFALVSSSYLQSVHSKHVVLDAKERYYNAFTVLECDFCSSAIGEVGHVGVRRVYKLALHRIKLLCTRSQISVSLSQSVCSEILSHAGAHAVYKYVIEGRQSCKPAVLIHLVGWNAELLASVPSNAEDKNYEFEKCIKVLFMKPEDAGFDLQAKQWLDCDTVELISLLDDDCAGLLQLLTTNSQRIPPQLRSMANMTRSFLSLS